MTLKNFAFVTLNVLIIFQNTYAENSTVGFDYSDFIDNPISVLRKCHCKAHEVYVDDVCKNQETFVGIFDFENASLQKRNTTNFTEIITEDLQCEQPDLKVPLGPEDFALTNFGELYLHSIGVPFHFDSYCIEHLINEDNKLSWTANVCIAPPPLPRCCHKVQDSLNSSCDSGMVSLTPRIIERFQTLTWSRHQIIDVNIPKCLENETLLNTTIETLATNLLYSPNGPFLSHRPSQYSIPFYKTPNEFCISAVETQDKINYTATFCYPKDSKIETIDCNNVTCISKCCREGETYDEEYQGCVESNIDFDISNLFYDSKRKIHTSQPTDIEFLPGFPSCFLIEIPPTNNKRKQPLLLTTGELFIQQTETLITQSHYCIDYKTFYGENKTKFLLYCANDAVELSEFRSLWNNIIMPVFLGISCVFMVATLLVFLSVSELRRKLSSQCLISQVTALLAAYISYTIILTSKDVVSDASCQALGTFAHISLLASFLWLNVMCFDMWKVLRSMQVSQDVNFGRFVKYSLYSWGIAFLIGGFGLIIDLLEPPALIGPAMMQQCFVFNDTLTQWLYLYGPILLIMVANTSFFIHVAIWMVKSHKEKKKLIVNSTAREAGKERVLLYIKLFLIMGVPWTTEILSSIEALQLVQYFWIVTDIINALRGLFIFVIFVCKKSTIELIKKSWEPQIMGVQTISSKVKDNMTKVVKPTIEYHIPPDIEEIPMKNVYRRTTSNLESGSVHEIAPINTDNGIG